MAGSARERRRAMYPNAFHSVPRYIPQDRPDDNGPGRTTADACLSQVVVYVDISGRSWTPLVLDVAVEAVAAEPVSTLPFPGNMENISQFAKTAPLGGQDAPT